MAANTQCVRNGAFTTSPSPIPLPPADATEAQLTAVPNPVGWAPSCPPARFCWHDAPAGTGGAIEVSEVSGQSRQARWQALVGAGSVSLPATARPRCTRTDCALPHSVCASSTNAASAHRNFNVTCGRTFVAHFWWGRWKPASPPRRLTFLPNETTWHGRTRLSLASGTAAGCRPCTTLPACFGWSKMHQGARAGACGRGTSDHPLWVHLPLPRPLHARVHCGKTRA
jgi:hypothetical protein